MLLLVTILTYPLIATGADTLTIQDTIRQYSIEEVVITANRKSSSVKDTPEAVRALENEQAEKFQMRSTPEALQITPGVFVQKTNHGGGSPIIRGLTGNQTLLLIDGIRLSNATYRYGPNQYLNTIDIFFDASPG